MIGSAQIKMIDPFNYTMVFVTSCQSDALYQEWNANLATFEPWISKGGFAALHGCVHSCGGAGTAFPQPPGNPVSFAVGLQPSGNVVDPLHPLMLGLPGAPTGTSLSHTAITSTNDPNDNILMNAAGNVLYFEREWGNGVAVVGGLTYEYGFVQVPPQDAGKVLLNEVLYGMTFGLCSEIDDDQDGVGNDCDVCPGFDDNFDADGDLIPDD